MAYTFDVTTRTILKDGAPLAKLVDGVQNEEGGLLIVGQSGFERDEALLDEVVTKLKDRNDPVA
jgi:hypothetical protein